MRKLLGGVLLAAGVGGLGYWGAKDHAVDMQTAIEGHARTAVSNATHAVQTEVKGRDIRISGLADSATEREALIEALNGVNGRRVVTDALELLPVAEPYTIAATRRGGKTLLQGNVPTETARARLGEAQADGFAGLTLAHGAPDNWGDAVDAGLSSLSTLDAGTMSLTGQTMRLTGIVDYPHEREALLASIVLPEGYMLEDDIETRDDGASIRFDVVYDAADGVAVNGKLPKGLTPEQIGSALGFTTVGGSVTTGLETAADGALGALGTLKAWLPEMESATLSVTQDTLGVAGVASPGVNLALVQERMQAEFGTDFDLSLANMASSPANGAERVNAATGQTERFQHGAWLPVFEFAPSLEVCTQQADDLLMRSKINFLSGSADLGPRALRAINALASVMGRCVSAAGLIVELGGHTDNTGSNNFELSAARAEAVRNAMIARGISEAAISAVGYGPSKPIADNATEEGRAANRRTTVRWAQQ